MEKQWRQRSERILNLTLEIIYLLTGEHIPPPLKCGDHVTIKVPETAFLTAERNDQNILEITQKITELLTGEVPIRCQDVSVYFSMEEWEYVEGHKELYKDIVKMEDQPPLTSPDGSNNMNTPERSPRPLDVTPECLEILQNNNQGETPIPIKLENTEELYVRGDVMYKETPPEISTDGHPSKVILKKDPFISPECEIEVEITFDSTEEDLISPNLHPMRQRADFSSDPSTHGMCFSDLAHPGAQVTACSVSEFKCNECGRSFDKKPRLIVHQRSHTGEKPYLCSECGKCFSQTSHLFRHVKIHSGKKPFVCSDCGRCFKEKEHLLRHQKVHTGEKPFVCPVCGKLFREKGNLLQHDIYHTGNYPYSCLECGKCFISKSRLEVHQKSHSGEKPYSCLECGKCFLHKSVFVRHQKVHLGLKPFICSNCGKGFRYQSHLTRHEKDHEGVKPYSCSDCGKCFSRRQALLSHQFTHRQKVPLGY